MAEKLNGETKITEDEAALYDRQIRLWGMEAQRRMRNATVLIMGLKGVATEAIKNLVLAGIGKLIIADGEDVAEHDLGSGFFFRDEDVGSKRVDAAKSRIEALNPLVLVEVISKPLAVESDELGKLIESVDMVCATDWSYDNLLQLNATCRSKSKPFYCGGTYGLLGYIFCDLLSHEYINPPKTQDPSSAAKQTTLTANYCALKDALRHSWKGLSKREMKETNPSLLFRILALWDYQHAHGSLPGSNRAAELTRRINEWIDKSEASQNFVFKVEQEDAELVVSNVLHEFSPVCAIIGGMLAQDMLKALSAREAPIANFLVFDGTMGSASVNRMGM